MLLRNVYTKSLFDRRKALVWWIAGLAVLIGLMVLFYPTIRDNDELSKLIESYPPEMLAIFGVNDPLSFTTPAGYLQGELFGFMLPLLFLIYAIGFGANALAGEEEAKTIDLLLANPVSRTTVVVQKVAALLSLVTLLGLITWLALWVSALLIDMEISSVYLLAASVSTILLALCFGMLTLALGALTGRKGQSMGISVALAVLLFFGNNLATSVTWLEPVQKLSPFYYAYGNQPLSQGFDWFGIGMMATISMICVGISVWAFNRRDVAV